MYQSEMTLYLVNLMYLFIHLIAIFFQFNLKIGKVCHLIGHVLGFFHEQSRPDREDYVKIIYENIKPDMITNFEYYPPSIINTFGFPYDYSSIMHFGQSVRVSFTFKLQKILFMLQGVF
jgi:hypothetical protein